MKGIVYLNGEFVAAEEARVSIFDRGYLFGDGVYEVVPVINSTLIDKENFLQRLEHSLQVTGIPWPYTKEKYVAVLEDLINRNNLRDGGVYTQVTRGVAPMLAKSGTGRIVNIAYLQGSVASVNFMPVMLKRLTVTGSTLRPQSEAQKAETASQLEQQVWPLLNSGRVKPVIAASFALEQASDAHKLMESNQAIGKIVLRVGDEA